MRGLSLPAGYPVAAASAIVSPQAVQAIPPEVSQSSAVTVTASATPHTVGAWAELIASNAAETQWLSVAAMNTAASATDTSALLDIGIGAAGSEVAVVTSLPVGFANIAPGMHHLLPLRVPRGARVAARMQGIISADTVSVIATTMGGAPGQGRSPSSLVTLGATTASSRGTNMPTSDTYVEITAATSQAFAGLLVAATLSGAGVSAQASVYTVAVGAAGTEVAIGTATFSCASSEAISRAPLGSIAAAQPFAGVIGRHIPAGVRLACKQSIGQTYRDVILFGVPYA